MTSTPKTLIARRQLALKLDTSVANASRIVKRNADFPSPVLLDARNSFRWIAQEVDAWINSRRRVTREEREECTAAAGAAEGIRRRAKSASPIAPGTVRASEPKGSRNATGGARHAARKPHPARADRSGQ